MPDIARLKIALDEVKPRVTRRLEVPLAIRLDELHLVIQVAMGWENGHLFEFRIGRDAWGTPDPDWDLDGGPQDAGKATLADLVSRAGGKPFKYVYDFGDNWHHTVKLEAVAEAEPGVAYPRLLAAQGCCPPEDAGGPRGYAEYLEAISDPEHERHAEMIDWRGPGFDANAVDELTIRRRLARLAKQAVRRKKKTGHAV